MKQQLNANFTLMVFVSLCLYHLPSLTATADEAEKEYRRMKMINLNLIHIMKREVTENTVSHTLHLFCNCSLDQILDSVIALMIWMMCSIQETKKENIMVTSLSYLLPKLHNWIWHFVWNDVMNVRKVVTSRKGICSYYDPCKRIRFLELRILVDACEIPCSHLFLSWAGSFSSYPNTTSVCHMDQTMESLKGHLTWVSTITQFSFSLLKQLLYMCLPCFKNVLLQS